MKVRIKRLPQARTGYQVNGSLANDVPAMGGADYNAYIGTPKMKVAKTMSAVPREEANLEAEGGETVVGNIDGSMMPSFYTIKGPRHTHGGVPLNLPDDSFIFSDTKSMKITDPYLLKMFNMSAVKGGYTPAQMSKKFDINKYRQILQDTNSDAISRKTAEMMIKNYTMKLGALALAQESKKGFPQGIPEIAKPYMEANKIPEEQFIPKEEQPQPEEQESLGEEAEGPSEEMPMNMPNGEPIAQPQEMSEEMPEEMGAPPMAMYGMSMGGYDMPFYDDPNEMEYGGMVYQKGGGKTREMTDAELEARRQKAKEIKKIKGKCPPGYRLVNGFCQKGTITEAEAAQSSLGKAKGHGNGQRNIAWEKTICAELSKGVSPEQLAANGHGTAAGIRNRFASCIKKGEEAIKTGSEDYDVLQLEDEPEVTPEKKCQCPDPMDETKWVDVECPEDGSEPVCGEDMVVTDQVTGAPPRQNPKWWLQDTVNTMGAFGDLMGVQKQMPWEARVDLEEPRPTFLDPTRELAAQSEQANIASDAAAQFAGPQALNARLSAIQGQGASQAANTLSNINNQNVNAANQFEGQQVGIRNQEQMMNQQMANRVYDKNVIANEQFNNSKRQGRANMREAYNTALTNRGKTDALNQMYPNYQVDPSTGGIVNYTPTDKTVDPGADEMTAEEYVNSISGYDPKIQQKLLELKFGKKIGGQIFAKGGFVYGDMMYPFIL